MVSHNSNVIYFVEDDRNIRDLVVYTLSSTGYDAQGCEDAASFWRAMAERPAELVLLDVMLPGTDGIQILRKLRSQKTSAALPVIMVTAKDAEYNKVEALDLGADDYVTKPFGMMELVSRVRALLRRTRQAAGMSDDEILTVGKVSLDIPRHLATVDGEPVELTLKEYELLDALMSNANILLSRDKLLDDVWGYSYHGETRTVDVHIRSLRKKLGAISEAAADQIKTVRGIGYKMSKE